MEALKILRFCSSQVLGRDIVLECMCKVGSISEDGIGEDDRGHHYIFVFEENQCRDLGGACFGGPDSLTAVMFRGCAECPTFSAVLCKTFTPMWFVVYHGFHTDGYRGQGIVVI